MEHNWIWFPNLILYERYGDMDTAPAQAASAKSYRTIVAFLYIS